MRSFATERSAHRLAAAAGWATVAVGLVHVAVARSAFDRFDLEALWFVGSGLAVILIGAITLAARHASLRSLAVAANMGGLALAIAFGMLTRWREPPGPVLSILFLAGIIGSTVRRGPARSL